MEDHGRQVPGTPGSPRRIEQCIPNKEMHVIQIIQSGKVDNALIRITDQIRARQEWLEEDTRKRVKQIFGDDAEIVTPPELTLTPRTILCGAEIGGIPTCGPASDCPHGRS